MKSILGRKVGMTQIFDADGVVTPVTVVQAGPMTVTQVKTVDTDGYNAIQVGYLDKKEKRVNGPAKGHFAKADVAAKKVLREIRLNDEDEAYELGQEINASIFEADDMVDVVGTSKGKGTQGIVKRHGFKFIVSNSTYNTVCILCILHRSKFNVILSDCILLICPRIYYYRIDFVLV